ncbi:MAG: hypothetical protein ABW068_15940 [Candidatus Thiodiazotropha sp.]
MESRIKAVTALGLFVLLLSLDACHQDDGKKDDAQPVSELVAVTPSVSIAGPKRLRFSWDDVGADHYQLLKNPEGISGYSPVGGEIKATRVDEVIAVHLTDWDNVSYVVEACTRNGVCVDSVPLSTSGLMIDAIGRLFPTYDPIYQNDFGPDCTTEFAMENCYGHAMAMSGEGAVMAMGYGADDVAARGVDGIPVEPYDYSMGQNSGAVFVFTRQGDGWSTESFIKSSSPHAGDLFGMSVALSRDGTMLAVGAPFEDARVSGESDTSMEDTEAVYLFTRTVAGWIESGYITIGNNEQGGEQFGLFVSLSSMGDRLAVRSQEKVYLYHDVGSEWRLEEAWDGAQFVNDTNAKTGMFALSGDGMTFALTASSDSSIPPETGSLGLVYIYMFNGVEWVGQGRVMASNADVDDYFGGAVSLSDDGNILAVGANREDSSALGVNGDGTDNSAESSGAAYLFERQGSEWRQTAYLKASNAQQGDSFGARLVLSGDGRSLVVTAPGEDSLASGINGLQTDDRAEAPPGAAYRFLRDEAGWHQEAYIKAPHTRSGDHYELPICGPEGCVSNEYFGDSLAISTDGSTLMIGVPGRAFVGSGSVYLY